MQLDKTDITIRRRSTLELYDLTLLVFKKHWKVILASSLIFAVPALLLDLLATSWMLQPEAEWAFDSFDDPQTSLRWRRAVHLVVLFGLQYSIVYVPTTILLGSLVFFEKITYREILIRIRKIWFPCIFVLGIIRLGIVPILLEPLVRREFTFDWPYEFFILIAMPICGLIIRAVAPFGTEILALEMCPLRAAKDSRAVTYRRRSSRLNGLLAGEHVGRMLSAALFSSLMLAMVLGIGMWGSGVSTGVWQWSAFCDYVWLPFALWIVGTFFCVFRFLAYLDSRIRLEGWEIELRMRAEGDRLSGKRRAISTGSSIADQRAVERQDAAKEVDIEV